LQHIGANNFAWTMLTSIFYDFHVVKDFTLGLIGSLLTDKNFVILALSATFCQFLMMF